MAVPFKTIAKAFVSYVAFVKTAMQKMLFNLVASLSS
tara:strand:+ start:267 stop:377 length:111 start_codon:yes stop_codon:yes gene_type:complete